MNKRLKKVTAVVMAMGMAATGSMASYAAEEQPPAAGATKESEMNISGTAGTQTSELTGYIAITNIKVKVPVKAGFDINPNGTVAVAADKFGLIETQASTYQIENLSTTELTVKISNVAVSGGLNLVTSEPSDQPTDAKKLMFAIKKAGVVPALATAGDWMTAGAKDYYLDASGAPLALKAKGDADGGDKVNMKLYGITKSGWTNGATFSVTPTFTIAVK